MAAWALPGLSKLTNPGGWAAQRAREKWKEKKMEISWKRERGDEVR